MKIKIVIIIIKLFKQHFFEVLVITRKQAELLVTVQVY